MLRSDLCLVTPSYRPDLERCKALCASVQRFVDPEIEHVLIVPRRDRAAFEPLANHRTRIETVESVLPFKAMQVPFQRRWWLTGCSLPVRGWIMQQLTKFAAYNAVKTDAMVFVDSDLIFIRPFTADRAWHAGKLRMHRKPCPAPQPTHARWNHDSCRLLGLPESDWCGADYIGPMATWHCQTVRDLLDHISSKAGKPWYRVLANMLHLSEYMLYGLYVEHTLKGEGHHYDESNLTHCSWDYQFKSDQDIEDFFGKTLDPHLCVVLMQSNQKIEVDRYTEHVERLIELNNPAEAA
ncbi:MAG: hypothetical protein KTR15_13965 [Phycisphaeraceae bacterium]|nr:hypothetical protein [Phycisphaeraceae bacterium]